MIQNTNSSNVGIKHRRLDSKQVLFIEKLWHQLLHTTLLMSSLVPLQDWQEFHPTTLSHTISRAGAPSGHHGSTQAELSSALLLSTPDLQTPGAQDLIFSKAIQSIWTIIILLHHPCKLSHLQSKNFPGFLAQLLRIVIQLRQHRHLSTWYRLVDTATTARVPTLAVETQPILSASKELLSIRGWDENVLFPFWIWGCLCHSLEYFEWQIFKSSRQAEPYFGI